MKKIDQVDQIGFVVDNIEEAAMHWVNTCGVGPFFIHKDVEYDKFTYKGEESPAKLTLAFSYIGSVMLELIYQPDSYPSVYTTFKQRSGTGLVHLARFCDDLEAAAKAFEPNQVLQYTRTPDGVETIYLDTEHHNGGLIEFIKIPEIYKPITELFQKTVNNWNGDRPLRYIDPENPFAVLDL
ncbi:TPA: VOC family protein [Pseudomonas aeruginosa]